MPRFRVHGDPFALDAEARERLRDNAEGLFTSGLTINENLLLEDAGFEQLGLVLGTAIVRDKERPARASPTKVLHLNDGGRRA